MIVAEAPYEVTDPTVDSQVVRLKASGADIFVNIATPRGSPPKRSEGRRARLDRHAHPQQRVANSVGSVLQAGGTRERARA
jgi:branched-chain amino acid transport system substrate-binding protein